MGHNIKTPIAPVLMHSERKTFRCGVFYIDPNEPAPEEGNAKTMFIGFFYGVKNYQIVGYDYIISLSTTVLLPHDTLCI